MTCLLGTVTGDQRDSPPRRRVLWGSTIARKLGGGGKLRNVAVCVEGAGVACSAEAGVAHDSTGNTSNAKQVSPAFP